MTRLRLYLRREGLALILAAIATTLLLNCLFARRGVRDLLVLKQRRLELEVEREHLRAQNELIKTVVQKLRSDDAFQKRKIRAELGYARPGEIVYRFAGESDSR